jgi:hypothetical protein
MLRHFHIVLLVLALAAGNIQCVFACSAQNHVDDPTPPCHRHSSPSAGCLHKQVILEYRAPVVTALPALQPFPVALPSIAQLVGINRTANPTEHDEAPLPLPDLAFISVLRI